MSAIAVRGLWKAYGDRSVLERIDLDVASGEFCTLVGASGCGKTTFLRLLLSQERPTRGDILLEDKPLPPEPEPGRGVVFQRYSVFPHLTVLENVILGLELRQSPWFGRLFGAARRKALEEGERWLASVGLTSSRNAYPASLSGGMQQRLAIAQALILHPKVLLLDEPFGALDPGIRADMHVLIRDLWRRTGMTVFMVTHDIREAFALGTRVLAFDRVRHDPHAPDAYGATITYDLPGRGEGAEDGTLIPVHFPWKAARPRSEEARNADHVSSA
ncbi:MAG: ABC transporter ATP-binding protein [Rhodospirillaceae bacterium]|nr:ABC transporter ATP-binding protein [Rhodospirillaceae bacterium]